MACSFAGTKSDPLGKPRLFRRRRMTMLWNILGRTVGTASRLGWIRELRLTSTSRYRSPRRIRRTILLNLILAAVLTSVSPVQAQVSDGSIPFGPLDEVDMDQLIKFGRVRGFDLQLELERIYKKDEAALARLFALSLRLKKFNRNARAYGQVIYTCYQRFTDAYGVDLYLKV